MNQPAPKAQATPHTTASGPSPNVRFTLRRVLFWLTALSIGLGLFFNSIHQQRRGIDSVHRFGGDVYYDFQLDHTGLSTAPDTRLPWTKLIDQSLGTDYSHHVVGVAIKHQNYGDDQLHRLNGLQHLQFIYLQQTHVTGWGLRHLRCSKHLHTLRLDGKYTDDSALAALVNLPNLRSVFLSGSSITDSGLRHLTQLSKLEELDLSHTGITSVGLQNLESLPHLRLLSLRSCTGISDRDVQHLATKLPALDYVDYAPALVERPQR